MTSLQLSEIEVIYISGVGSVGDVMTMRPMQAYRQLLLPGLAVYATPENLLKYKVDEDKPKPEDLYSSPYVQRVHKSHCFTLILCSKDFFLLK